MLELIDISFEKNDKKILNNINLCLEDDKFYCITGPNGSGKSTLAKIIMGIEKPSNGKIIYNNEDITNLSIDERARKGISFSFQNPVRFKGITVYDLISLSSDKYLTHDDAKEILNKVGLNASEYLDREINESLSGGELKRIEIASTYVRNSKLSIFDEPEAGIDLWSFNNLIKLFELMRKENNGTTLIISHQERILNIANKIIMMKNGSIDKIGNKKDFSDLFSVGENYE